MSSKNIRLSTFLIFILVFPYQFIGENQLVKAIPFVVFLLILISRITQIKWSLKGLISYSSCLLAWIFVEMLRNNHPQATVVNAVFKILIILLFIVIFNSIKFKDIKELEKSFFYSTIGVFACLAILSYIFKILNISEVKKVDLDLGTAVILSSFGLNVNRVSLPLTGGINSYSSLLGLLLVLSILTSIYHKKFRISSIIIGSIFFSQLLLLDSRGSVFYPLIAIISILLFYKLKQISKLNILIPILSIIGPFLFIFGLFIFVNYFEFDSILRSSSEAYTGNSRLVIWLISLEEFLDFKLIHIFGYGEFGHYASGKSLLWESSFRAFENSDMMHPHNTDLVLLYDYGYFGMFLYLMTLVSVLNRLKIMNNISKNKMPIVIMGGFLYISFIGTSESFFGFYYQNVFNVLLIIVLYTLKLEKKILEEYGK